MQIEVKSVNERGHGYCVVHLDDGTSFGQHFQNLPVEDGVQFDLALEERVAEAVLHQMPLTPKIIAAVVMTRIGVKKDRPVKIA